ncbi:putative exocyst complex component SEC5 [Xylona heveae TC161]|uniref:Exocyst complex component SEC5 n=1 Tax=Xylona heveae (strain CBS 132557 / TC161) TaxID=1328760 RepID=A0A161TCB8_XYLHT|nr:putative exocyst complex component SEC5 [Xylona heveae TC161]KZF23417.1 putative exocyst complex component SEC5 [Xylona heveae TC161]
MESEHTILNHYNLSTPYPTEWPAEKDEADASDEDIPQAIPGHNNIQRRQSKSRYSALDRRPSEKRRLVPGAQRGGNGLENLVHNDEPDALGQMDSVVNVLRERGLPVDEDLRLRYRFLLSSTTFSPALFLSNVHSEDSIQSLLQGLSFLSRSIDQKSASLKALVESNFERFVRAKTTIDNVYTEMRNQGAAPESDRSPGHSRHASRSSAHFRNSSANIQAQNIPSAGNRKNALTKESEYGVHGIKTPLVEVSVKAEEVWGPALGGKEKGDNLKAILASVERHHGILEVGGALADCIKRKDYESLVEEYIRARRYAEEARNLAKVTKQHGTVLTDQQIHQIVITARMWADVENRIQEFKRDTWKKLVSIRPSNLQEAGMTREDEHMELISILLELGVEENPVWVWLQSQYEHLKSKIGVTSDRFKVEVEILRRRLALEGKPSIHTISSHLRAVSRQNVDNAPGNIDRVGVLEVWEKVRATVEALLHSQKGILGEVQEFWESAQSFIEGKLQKTLPVGLDGQSRQHHRLSEDHVDDLRKGVVELIDLIKNAVFSFFADPPIEDISMLVSPIPPSPATPAGISPLPTKAARLTVDPHNLPPPSPRVGEAWEDFAFWPPYANALGGVYYLGNLIVLVGTAASELATVSVIAQNSRTLEGLRLFVGAIRERCAQAICAAWGKDAENCKALEDWTPAPQRKGVTQMPTYFLNFEMRILGGMQRMLYISEAMARSGSTDVVLPPPSKLLQLVRSQFVGSVYKVFSGMVENAEKRTNADEEEQWDRDTDILTSEINDLVIANTPVKRINSKDRNSRMLLILSNLQILRTEIIPQLISQYETDFSVTLSDEHKTILDVLGQIDSRIFQSYTRPTVDKISTLVLEGIASPSWPPTTPRPTDVRPYVYEVLLLLILVHTEVTTTTASTLTSRVLCYLQEQMALALLEGFKKRRKYPLSSLMQATLDVEFIAQTLNQYATDKVSDATSRIYLELDKGTDEDARRMLQNELPEMRATLKRLREHTRSEFACFKRPRAPRDRADRPSQPQE